MMNEQSLRAHGEPHSKICHDASMDRRDEAVGERTGTARIRLLQRIGCSSGRAHQVIERTAQDWQLIL